MPIRFQSTLPAWGATSSAVRTQFGVEYFNPRSPRGERRRSPIAVLTALDISIHAPRVGSDIAAMALLQGQCISIHAPRVGSDAIASAIALAANYFNPRSPRGERQLRNVGGIDARNFNPRSPRGERHDVAHVDVRAERHFNPRSPRGERRSTSVILASPPAFQSTLPAWGATPWYKIPCHNV